MGSTRAFPGPKPKGVSLVRTGRSLERPDLAAASLLGPSAPFALHRAALRKDARPIEPEGGHASREKTNYGSVPLGLEP